MPPINVHARLQKREPIRHKNEMTTTIPGNAHPAAASETSNSNAAADETGGVILIPGFETDDTLERFGNDVELYHTILELLIPTLTEALGRFDTARAARDNAGLKAEVRSIRGMASNVGAAALATSAGALETSLRDGANGEQV